MEDKKRRRPANPFPDMDARGPAAWGESPPETGRRSAGSTRRVRHPREPENGGKKKAGAPKVPKVKGRKKRSLFLRFVIWLFWTGLALGLAGLVVLFFVYSYLDQDLPSIDGLKNYAPPTVTYFYADDGQVIGEYSHERRFVVPISEVPPMVISAFLAVEDADFYKHKGVNPKALIRAAIANFKSDRITQGGSTITQQLVKTFLLTPERSYVRKAKEMILAYRVEQNLSKEEILYLYLNQIYLGRGAYGVEAAARTYFDKSAKELSIAEAAQLAGIVQGPNNNPINEPKIATDRRLYAIARMLEVGAITQEQYEQARAETLKLQYRWPNPSLTVAPYFAEHVRRMMEERFGAESLYNDGWKVYTTVNVKAQHDADAAVARGLWEYSRRRGYRGPVQQLSSEAEINQFLKESAEDIDEYGLGLDRLYQAVITEVDSKNKALELQIGPYRGHISKKNLAWALKKEATMAWALKKTDAPEKSFQRGDVIWIRLLAEENGQAVAGQTTADQNAVVGRLTDTVLEMSLEQRLDTQSALLSMDLTNGDVKAMVGGRDSRESQFNRATQSQRQPGSSFKPILYASAMDHGFTPGSIMIDAPFVVDDPGSGKRWKPVNSDLKFKGPMSLYTALVGSRNLISIKLLDRIGFEALAETARNLGITEKLPESLTIALGAHGLHMPELLSAYSAFPNMGERVVPRYITRIEDRHGNVVETFEPQRIPSLDPGSACAVTWMLRGVVEHGTGTVVKPLGRPVGGKTGTTNDYSDAWFVGFTPELVTAVWVGTDRQRPRAVGEVGGKAAGPMFLYYMQEVLKDKEITDFVVPPEAEVVKEGGPFGVCYRAGTVGTGLSEAIVTSNPEDEFMRGDFEEGNAPEAWTDPGQGRAPSYDGIDRGDYDRGQGYRPPTSDSSGTPSTSFTPRPQQPPAARPASTPVPTPPAPASTQGAAPPTEAPAQAVLPPPQPAAQPQQPTAPSYGSTGGQSGRGPGGRLTPYGQTTPPGSNRLPTYGEEETRPVFDEEVFERDTYFGSGN